MPEPSLFQAASTEAQAILRLGMILFWVSVFILGLVTTLVLAGAWRFRDDAPEHGPVLRASDPRRLELIWTLLPIGLVTALFVLALPALRAPFSDVADQPDVIVIGHQWWWEVRYPGTPAVSANELHLAAGERATIEVRAADVMHSFWVPSLGPKMDMIPGRVNRIVTAPDTPGLYGGVCSEFCGAQHAWMRLRVIVQTPDEFRTWLAAEGQPAAEASQSESEGLALFISRGCTSCHSVRGLVEAAEIGPDLTHLASRSTIGAGVAAFDSASLAAWLTDPESVKPSTLMPNFQLDSLEVRALVGYLRALR